MTTTERKGGHVVRLVAENVKRLRAVDISPTSAAVVIRGNNAQGKTSVLDAIMLALGGKSVAPPKVIREGAPAARVVLELEDLVVERRWTANDRSTLEVRSKEGAKYSSPQAMLDRLVGDLSFDPLAFMRLRPEDQARTLSRLIGFDQLEHEARRRAIFDERTVVNRDVHQTEARLAASPKPEGDPMPVDPKSLVDEMGQLMERDRERSAAQRLADASRRDADIAKREEGIREQRVTELERALMGAREELVEARARTATAETRATEAANAFANIHDPAPDMTRVREALGAVEKTNAAARQAAEHIRLAGELEAARTKSRALTQRIEKLDEERDATMTAAKMPVEGLAIAEGVLTLRGLPIEQASSAEQLTVSVAMGLALNPKLRVLLVRDGSLLDPASMAVLTKMAADADAQVWIEVVGDQGVGVVIEDGAVKATTSPAADAPAQGNLL